MKRLLINRLIVITHDLIFIPFAWFGAYWLRFNLEPIPAEFVDQAFTLFNYVLCAQALSYFVIGSYRSMWGFVSSANNQLNLSADQKAIIQSTLSTNPALVLEGIKLLLCKYQNYLHHDGADRMAISKFLDILFENLETRQLHQDQIEFLKKIGSLLNYSTVETFGLRLSARIAEGKQYSEAMLKSIFDLNLGLHDLPHLNNQIKKYIDKEIELTEEQFELLIRLVNKGGIYTWRKGYKITYAEVYRKLACMQKNDTFKSTLLWCMPCCDINFYQLTIDLLESIQAKAFDHTFETLLSETQDGFVTPYGPEAISFITQFLKNKVAVFVNSRCSKFELEINITSNSDHKLHRVMSLIDMTKTSCTLQASNLAQGSIQVNDRNESIFLSNLAREILLAFSKDRSLGVDFFVAGQKYGIAIKSKIYPYSPA